MPLNYFPILRTKAGEVDALSNLSATAKAKTLPIVRMTAGVPATFLTKMVRDLQGFPIALDGIFNFDQTGIVSHFRNLFNSLGQAGVPVIPVVRNTDNPIYIQAVSTFVGTFGGGIVVQCSLADTSNISGWIAAQGWSPGDVDLLVDVGGVAEHNPTMFAQYVSSALNAALASSHGYRRVALYSWSAPRDHGSLPSGRSLVPRRDWSLWQAVQALVSFEIHYSDNGHVHPSLEEVPGYAMANATVSVRYTIDDYWIVRKGVRVSGPTGIDMSTQYRNHARSLIAEQGFNGLSNCWGDTRVLTYAGSERGAGGRGQWAALSLNRHISHVCDRLP
jgi:hypothetical protein